MAIKVSEHLGINKGTELMALIPALSMGSSLKIVTQHTNGIPTAQRAENNSGGIITDRIIGLLVEDSLLTR